MGSWRTGISTVVSMAVLAVAPGAAEALVDPGNSVLPNLDVRADEKPSAGEERAITSLESSLGQQGFADTDGGGVSFLGTTDGYLTGGSGASPEQISRDYVADHRGAFGLDRSDLSHLNLTDEYTSIDGVTHLTFSQMSHGIASYDTFVRTNVDAKGRLINVSGSPAGDVAVASATPALGARDALAIAHDDVGGEPQLPAVKDRSDDGDRATTFAGQDEQASLTIFAGPNGDRLAWRVYAYDDDSILYDVVVDADSGKVLARTLQTEFAANQATIWPYFPQNGGTPNTVNLGTDPSWIDRSTLDATDTLVGNNAHAYADANGTNGYQAGEGVAKTGGNDWLFTTQFFTQAECPSFGCTWDSTNAATKTNNKNDATTDLFYLVNQYHDHLLAPPIGFDEASKNYEQVNSSGQGLGGDAVLAEANDSSGIDNANFSTVADGTPGRMQMYFWSGTTGAVGPQYDVNGSDSADVIFHEYTHGMSQRLVGNATGLAAAQSGAMGEAWSDWYAMDYLVDLGLQTDTAAPGEAWLGQYVTGVPGIFGGISRIRHQAIDCPVGASASVCPDYAGVTAGPGGYTYGDLGHVGTINGVHDNGEIWSQTLWDLRNALGSHDAEAVITGGMRLSPLNPSFLQERDAILQSAQNLGIPIGPIWQVFAHRGMGYLAVDQGSNVYAGLDDFTVPAPVTHISTSVSDPGGNLGDGDGVAEPGETVIVKPSLRNPLGTGSTAVTATMSSSTPGVVVGEPNATWPDFGTSVVTQEPSSPFTLTIPESQSCGTAVDASFAGSASSGAFSIANASIPIGGPFFTNSADVPKAIPDNNASGVNSTLSLPAGTVSDLDVRIGQLNHTWVGDLKITLSHGATTVTLMNRPGPGTGGASGNDFTNLILDDEAATPIDSIPSAGPPGGYTGSFKPDQPLSAFDGQSTAGTWTLNVSDNAAADTGSLVAWGSSPAPQCDVTALPGIDTAPASGVGPDTATLNANLDPKSKATDYRFEYGATDAYGTRTPVGTGGSGSGATPVSTPVSGLSPTTTYHFRALALRDGVIVARGPDQTFTTSAALSGPPPVADAVAKITKGPKKKSTKKKAKFEFTSNEPGASFTCKLDSKPATACTSPTKYKRLKKGKHTFSVTATGASGKAGPAATQTWKVKKKKKKHHHHHHH
jgi:hypothetical protein